MRALLRSFVARRLADFLNRVRCVRREEKNAAVLRIQAAARGSQQRNRLVRLAVGLEDGKKKNPPGLSLIDLQLSLQFELEKVDIIELEELAVIAGISREHIRAAIDTERVQEERSRKLGLIELVLYAKGSQDTAADLDKYDLEGTEDISSSEVARGTKAHAPRFGLRRVKDEFLGTTKDGRLIWSWKYTLDEKEFLMDRSFGLWDQDNAFRQFVYVFMANKWIEGMILTCIVVQTVFLGLAIPGDTEFLEQGIFPQVKWITKYMDNFFLFIYVIEMALRMIALGAWHGKHSYAKSSWNLLDGSLVVMSLAHMIIALVGVNSRDSMATHPSTNGIRLIRCLRPLRTASFVKGVKSAMGTKATAFSARFHHLLLATGYLLLANATVLCCAGHWKFLGHIAILLLFSMSMFGVMGVQLFGGVFSFDCASEYSAEEMNYNLTTCPRMLNCEDDLCVSIPEADRPHWGYDDLGQSMITGWIATTGDMYSPNMVTNLSTSNALYSGSAWCFCILMVLFLQLIVAHLFSAVVVHSFLQDSSIVNDAAAIEHKISRQKQVFMRIDHDHSGEIDTSELWKVTLILGLQDMVSL